MVETSWTAVDGGLLLGLQGRFGLRHAPEIAHLLEELVAENPERIVCDLAGLDYLDPRCVPVVVGAQEQPLAAATSIVLAAASGQPLRVLGAFGVDRSLRIAGTVAYALRSRPPPSRLVRHAFPTGLRAVSSARQHAAQTCEEWRIPQHRDDVLLLVDELVSNAVQHAGTELEVRLLMTAERVVVAVADRSPVPPLAVEADGPDEVLADGGRGLRLVAARSVGWGWNPRPLGGKVVWAVLANRPDARVVPRRSAGPAGRSSSVRPPTAAFPDTVRVELAGAVEPPPAGLRAVTVVVSWRVHHPDTVALQVRPEPSHPTQVHGSWTMPVLALRQALDEGAAFDALALRPLGEQLRLDVEWPRGSGRWTAVDVESARLQKAVDRIVPLSWDRRARG